MGVVAENSDRIAVMYAGKVMEYGRTADVFAAPLHPYTMGLRNAFPDLGSEDRELISIAGSPPGLLDPITGCRFAGRCPFAEDACRSGLAALVETAPGHWTACRRSPDAPRLRELARVAGTWQDGASSRRS
jgi:peptide/nickel transport system ATP-binding protein